MRIHSFAIAIAIALVLLFGSPLVADQVLINYPTCLKGDPVQPKSVELTPCETQTRSVTIDALQVNDLWQFGLGQLLEEFTRECTCPNDFWDATYGGSYLDDIDKKVLALSSADLHYQLPDTSCKQMVDPMYYMSKCRSLTYAGGGQDYPTIQAMTDCYGTYRKACAATISDAKQKIASFNPYTLTRSQTCHAVDNGMAVPADLTSTYSTSVTVDSEQTQGVTMEESLGITIGNTTTKSSSEGVEASVSVGAFGFGGSVGASTSSSVSEENSKTVARAFDIQEANSSTLGKSQTVAVQTEYKGGSQGARYVLWQIVDTFTLTRANGDVVSQVKVNGPTQINEYSYGVTCQPPTPPPPPPPPPSPGYVACPAAPWFDTGGLNCKGCSGTCLKPGDPAWPNSKNADHYCCKQ
jgi:hypothetical protein